MMNLIEVHKISETAFPGCYDFDVTADIGSGHQRIDYTYVAEDDSLLNFEIAAWWMSNPDFEIAPYVEPSPEPVAPFTRLYKSSLIRRMTATEAVTFEAILNAEEPFVRMMFNAVEWFDSSDALVSYMHMIFSNTVGEERADVLLKPEI